MKFRLLLPVVLGLFLSGPLLANSANQRFDESRSRKLFEQGVEHYNAGRYYSALDIFRRLKNHPPEESPQITASTLMCMKSYAQVGRYDEAKATAREFLKKFNDSAYLPDIHMTLGDIYVSEGYHGAALESYLKARSAGGVRNPQIDEKLFKLSSGFVGKEKLNALMATETNSTSRSILSLALANGLIYESKRDEAALILFKLDKSTLPKSFQEYYEKLRGETYEKRGKSKTIGLILSTSGPDEKMGLSFLKGVHEATRDIQKLKNFSISTEIIDIEGDALSGIQALKHLTQNSNVLAVIGPRENSASLAVAAAGKDGSTPLLFPTSDLKGLSSVGESIYQMNTDLSLQGRYAARYAAKTLSAETVAVLAPSDRLGKELADGFLNEADELGVEIVSVEWYSGIPVDLSPQLTALRNVAFRLEAGKPKKLEGEIVLDTADNTFDISSTDFFAEEATGDLEKEEVDSTEIVLSTIDAVYLPIHPGDINYVTSQFSSYGLETQLLGNVNWYDPDELNQDMIGSNLQGMIILTDYLHPQEQQSADRAWEITSNIENRDEIRMALAGYDLTMFLGGYLESADSRAALKMNLERAVPLRGLSKFFAFSPSEPRLNASIHLLRYAKNRLTLVGEFVGDSLYSYILEIP